MLLSFPPCKLGYRFYTTVQYHCLFSALKNWPMNKTLTWEWGWLEPFWWFHTRLRAALICWQCCSCRRHADEATATEQMEWRRDIVRRRPPLSLVWKKLLKATTLCYVRSSPSTPSFLLLLSQRAFVQRADLQTSSSGAPSSGEWLQSQLRLFSCRWGRSEV